MPLLRKGDAIMNPNGDVWIVDRAGRKTVDLVFSEDPSDMITYGTDEISRDFKEEWWTKLDDYDSD